MIGARGKPVGKLAGRRVTVVGLGRFGGGVGVTRWLCKAGANVTVSDKADAESLASSIAKLEGMKVAMHLGGHVPEDFMAADLLVVSPAVPTDMPLLVEARRAGVPHTTEINLFIERCRAPLLGVTGSVGKSTTAAMAAEILSGKHATHFGGNIGVSLLEELDAIGPEHVVVLELSSFQLEYLPIIGVSPGVAVVTNLAPNHLDRHGSLEAYGRAKTNIFRFQRPGDVLILNRQCRATAGWKDIAPGRVEYFDPAGEPFELAVLGEHNQANAQAAWAAARSFGIDRQAAAKALAGFRSLPHRLQFVAERDGVRYYNDSKCTTPDGAIVALRAFEPRRAVVIAGGYDKGVDFGGLGAELAGRAKAVIAVGATREAIVAAVEAHRKGDSPVVSLVDDLASAVRVGRRLACAGDVVLLSPACASYDMFVNYEQRGELFAELVSTGN